MNKTSADKKVKYKNFALTILFHKCQVLNYFVGQLLHSLCILHIWLRILRWQVCREQKLCTWSWFAVSSHATCLAESCSFFLPWHYIFTQPASGLAESISCNFRVWVCFILPLPPPARCQKKPSIQLNTIFYIILLSADPVKVRGCPTNTAVIHSFIHSWLSYFCFKMLSRLNCRR